MPPCVATGLLAAFLVGTMLASAETPKGPARAALLEAYGQVPLTFEANVGQTDPQVAFLARGAGYTLFLTPREAVLSLSPAAPEADGAGGPGGVRARGVSNPGVVRMKLEGANRSPHVTGLDPQATRSHYFVGDDPARWRKGVPHFGRVRYERVYPGIDLVYYGRQSQLEYDFVVQAGGDPRRIRMDFQGADRVESDAGGDLLVHVGERVLRQHKPIAYQERDGVRRPVAVSYVLTADRRATFRVAKHDPSLPLVIDPVLVHSTYLGGASIDKGNSVALDRSGDAYLTGLTFSLDFPTVNGTQGALAGLTDAFVVKINAAGSAVVYATYMGGSDSEEGLGIAVDDAGNACVTGATYSTNFPIVNAIQNTNSGMVDAFVAKLTANGSALVYSTYLGGLARDGGQGVAMDGLGNAYVTGYTTSENFPTANAFQSANAGVGDAFVAKLSPSGSTLVYSTYLGGSLDEFAVGIALDSPGDVYIAGTTGSTDLPTASPIQGANAGGPYDTFVAKLNAAGSALAFSTYLGGSGDDQATSLAVDASGNAYVAGLTTSTDFPTVNAIQGANAGGPYDGFVAKIDTVASAFVYSTYIGGSDWDFAQAVAADTSGRAWVVGRTWSTDFPTMSAIQAVLADSQDAFVTQLNADGSAFVHSTYLGGDFMDEGLGVRVDASGSAWVVGGTSSADFPTVNPIQSALAGGPDVFVAKIADTVKGDLDRDGYADLVFRNNLDGRQNKVWFMNGVVRASEAAITPDAASADWRIRGVDDFDLDGANDLVFWNQVTGHVEFWFMNGTARVGSPVPLSGAGALPATWELAATADFNHDLRPDVLWRNVASQKLLIWTMNASVKLGEVVPTPEQAVDANWGVVAALDHNNDGNTDFLWYNSTSGKLVTWYMSAAIVRTAGQFTTPANAGDNNWKVLASADYSRGAVPATPPLRSPDLVWRNETSGNQVVWHMNFGSSRTSGGFTSPTANMPALDWTIVGPR